MYKILSATWSRSIAEFDNLVHAKQFAEKQRKIWTNAKLRIEKDGKVVKAYPALKPRTYTKKEYRKFYFRLSGNEGHDWMDLTVSGYGENKEKLRKIPLSVHGTVHYIVEVKGFIDEKASTRDW